MNPLKNSFKCISTIVILTLSLNAFTQVVINEVMAKPSGGNTSQEFQSMYNSTTSYGHEWVELYNTDPCTPVDISCWTLGGMDGGTNGGGFSFPNGTVIPPLGFIVIGGPNAPNVDFNLNDPAYNPGSGWLWTSAANRWHLPNGDGWLSLYDPAGNSVDAVYWTFSSNDPGKISTDGTYDGTPQQGANCGSATLASAETIFNGGGMEYITFATSTGQTFARDQDGSMNWIIDTPTPKACNGVCVVSNPFTIDYTIVTEACLGDNNGSITVDNINGGSGSFTYSWTPGGSGNLISGLSPGNFNLIITDNITGCQFDTTFVLPPGPNCVGCPNPWAYNTNTTPNTICNGTMTTCVIPASVVINEVMPTPSGGNTNQQFQSMFNTTASYGHEYVELYNPSPCDAMDISCFTIGGMDGGTNGGGYSFPAGTTIPPLGFLVIGGPNAPNVDINLNAVPAGELWTSGANRWHLPNGDGWLVLYDPGGNAVDGVYWTFSSNDAGKISTDGTYDGTPQQGSDCGGAVLASAETVFNAGGMEYLTNSTSAGLSYQRSVDGGATWVQNSQTAGNCNGSCATPSPGGSSTCDGTATATPTNGTAPYSYQWDANANSQTTQTAVDLCAGTYCVTITDNAGCDTTICINVIDDFTPVTHTLNEAICTGQSYTLNGTTYTTTGIYTETFIGGASNGCDSIVTLNLTVDPVINVTENINACENSTVTYPDGTTATITASTSYTSNLTSVAGCDSIIVTNVTMDAIYNITENINACENSTVTYPDGTTATITASTSYTSNLTSIAGCDSIIVTNVTMDAVYNITENINACENSTVTYPDGTTATITASTSYTSNLTSVAGCDSIIVTNVTMDAIYNITENINACENSTVTYPDGTTATITASTSYTSNLTSIAGCDSIIVTNVTMDAVYNITENINACENSTVTYPDGTTATITANTSYTSNLTSVAGCDSIIVTNVTMDAIYNITENVNACENSTVTYPDGTTATITASTSYTSNLTSVAGCDSIIVTNVTMDPVFAATENVTVCTGADYTYPDGTVSTNITVNESHVSNLTTVSGCDSIVTTNVSVNSVINVNENFNICSGSNYTYPDGTTSTNITVNESHVSNFVSVQGCDSVVTTNLTIEPVFNITENINACENSTVTYPDGTTATITASTSYTSNLTSVAGCDSTIVTNVTMDPVYNITENINACENSTVTYPDGTTATITASTSYTSNLTSVAGCDSIIVTNVTMDAVYNIAENINACENSTVTYPDGTTATITASTSYTSNLTSVAGCDSIIVTNVTMDPVYNITENINACENSTVTYPDGTTATITASTSYTSNLTSVAGCDSIIVTNVTMDAVYNITENINACENSTVTYPDGTTATITASTSYTSNLTSVAGCDSIIVTNVTMDPVYNITENINACENSTVTYPDGTTATITASTSYTSNLTSLAGCDSIIVTNVVMDPIFTVTLQASICSGDDYTYPDGTTHVGITVDETYTSIFTSINGCDSTVITQLTVNPLPIIIAGADQSVCEGQSVTLTATGAVNYSWDNGISNGVSFTPSIPSLIYTVTGTDANGCVSTDQVTVNVNPNPNVAFYADITSGCSPLEVTFVNQTDIPGTNCIWELGDGTTLTGCDSITYVYYTSGIYDISLTVTSANGCTSNAFYTDHITVVDPPEAIISADTYFVDINDPEVQFYNNSINADSYYWNFGDGNSSFNEEPSHSFPEIGNTTYTVTMVASNSFGCIDSALITINVQDILIYYVPNVFTPDGDQFNETFQPVFTSGYDPYDFHLMIFNRWGELIFESYNANIGWDGTYGDGGLVQDGVYVWKINFKETMSDKKHEVYGHVTVLK